MPSVVRAGVRNPLTFGWRALRKLFVDRIRYGRGDDYDAQRYWGDRLSRYGSSLRGPGRDGLSEAENDARYRAKAERFTQFCLDEGIAFEGKRVLEIGCGTGFFTGLITELAPAVAYTGVDITDVQFERLAARNPGATFVQADVTEPGMALGQFDVIVMIDVIEHIVKEERFRSAMANVRSQLAPGGAFVVVGFGKRDGRPLFYVRWWSLKWFEESFPGYAFSEPRPFSFDGEIMAITSPRVG